MSTIIWTNTQQAIDILWPALNLWASNWGYKMPNIEYTMSYKYNMLDTPTIGYNCNTVGNFNETSREINIAFTGRDKRSKMYTLIHELAHMVQYFNLTTKFNKLYVAQTKEKGYYRNQFEVEARDASLALDTMLSDDPGLKKMFKRYNWLITRPQSIYSSWGRCSAPEYYRPLKNTWSAKRYFGKLPDYY